MLQTANLTHRDMLTLLPLMRSVMSAIRDAVRALAFADMERVKTFLGKLR